MYYVYEYVNPVNKEVFYVGKGRNRRYKSHLTSTSNDRFSSYLEILLENDIEPIIRRRFWSEDEQLVLDMEEYLIGIYGRLEDGGTLCNYLTYSSTNTKVEIPDEVKELMGTMSDRQLGEVSGINWSTIRDYRNAYGIKSFRSQNIGSETLSKIFRRDNSTYKIYSVNGDVAEGTRYELEGVGGLSSPDVNLVLSGSTKHVKGWSCDKSIIGVITQYTKKSVYNFETDEVLNMTYKELAKHANLAETSCRNLYSENCKSLKDFVMLENKDYRPDRKDYSIIELVKEDVKVSGTRTQLSALTGLSSGDISNLTRCYQKTAKGWHISKIDEVNFTYVRNRKKRR